jgi:hypothetical protein
MWSSRLASLRSTMSPSPAAMAMIPWMKATIATTETLIGLPTAVVVRD